MADTIGRADYELRADQSGLVTDLAAAEGKIKGSGAAVEKSAAGTGMAFKAAAATAAVGFGMMAKGAIEMEGAQGKFQAATGASREEAVAFSKDMNSLMGTSASVGKSFQEVSDTGVEVARQFDLTGEAGKEMTTSFLEFAKVTGSDSVAAVESLDGALDAFHLPAEAAAGVMDQLIASNQKYGTEVGPQTIDMMAKMAPAMQAMGADMDDTVALLNLWEDAGLDAAGAMRGLNTAVTNLPEGQTLEGFIQHLQDLRNQGIDPTAEAIEVFGAKAGAGMANSLKPGGNALEAYRITAEEAEGATTKASEAMDTTADHIRMFADKAFAALRGLGQEFGPVLSGFGGLATGIAALPSKITGPLASGITGMATKLIGPGTFVGTAVGSAMATATQVAATGQQAVAALVAKVAAMSIPMAGAGTTVGTATGAAMGAAIPVAAGAAIAGAFVAIPYVLDKLAGQDPDSKIAQAGAAMADKFAEGYSAEAKATYSTTFQEAFRAALAAGASYEAAEAAGKAAADATLVGYASQVALASAALNNPLAAAITGSVASISQSTAFQNAWTGTGQAALDAIAAGAAQQEGAYTTAMRASILSGTSDLGNEVTARWREIGAAAPGAIGDAIYANATKALSGLEHLREVLKNGLTPEQIAMEAIGEKAIRDVGRGLRSEIPGLKEDSVAVAVASISAIEQAALKGAKGQKGAKAVGAYFDELVSTGMTAKTALQLVIDSGVDIDSAAMAGVRSKYPDLFKTGEAATRQTNSGFNSADVLSGAHTGGANVAKSYIAGFDARLRNTPWEAIVRNSGIMSVFFGGSPPPKGPLHTIDKAGEGVADEWVGGFAERIAAGASKVTGALSGYRSAFAIGTAAFTGATPGQPGGPMGAGMVVNVGDINVAVTGVPAGEAGAIGDSVAAKVREALDDVFTTAERGARLQWSTGMAGG
jgi:Phage-related minor tail protein